MGSETGSRGGPPPGALKLSEVRQRCGIGVDTLRRLIDDGALPGAVRAKNGHVYLTDAAVPTYQRCVDLIEQRLRAELDRSAELLRLVETELEAVRNDVSEAIDNPYAPLGYDLLTLRTRSVHHDPQASKLAKAMGDLEMATWSVRVWHDDLRSAASVHEDQTD